MKKYEIEKLDFYRKYLYNKESIFQLGSCKGFDSLPTFRGWFAVKKKKGRIVMKTKGVKRYLVVFVVIFCSLIYFAGNKLSAEGENMYILSPEAEMQDGWRFYGPFIKETVAGLEKESAYNLKIDPSVDKQPIAAIFTHDEGNAIKIDKSKILNADLVFFLNADTADLREYFNTHLVKLIFFIENEGPAGKITKWVKVSRHIDSEIESHEKKWLKIKIPLEDLFSGEIPDNVTGISNFMLWVKKKTPETGINISDIQILPSGSGEQKSEAASKGEVASKGKAASKKKLAKLPVQKKNSTKGSFEFPFTEKELNEKVFSLAKTYFAEFQDPKTYVLYGGRLRYKNNWTSPADCKAKKPYPWGYGSNYADTALHTGHTLVAFLDAYSGKPDPFLKESCQNLFKALKYIYESCPIPGIVPRGPHPDDRTAYYDDSSMDQNTTFIISLARYANSSLATKEDKAFIKKALNEVGTRLEKYGWSIRRADGVTQSHVGFAWTGMTSSHAGILIPAVFALYKGTGNEHWLDVYNKFSEERNGYRWELLKPGPHTKLNAHPIYANQAGFRLNALYYFLEDEEKKKTIYDLMTYLAKLQLARDFPGEFFRRFTSEESIKRAGEVGNWGDSDVHGAKSAWQKFKPSFLDSPEKGLLTLTHVRFPLGGFYMVMTSENEELIEEYLDDIWDMLNTVDLKKIYTGETNYLFTVVALHVYDFYYSHRNEKLN